MNPVLLSIYGSCAIHWYGVCIALGVCCALWGAIRALEHAKIMSGTQVLDVASSGILAGVVGGRLLHVLSHRDQYAAPIEWLYVWQGGLSILGTVVMATGVVFFHLRRMGVPIFATLDRIALYLPIAHAFGRVGCFIAGCCYGHTIFPLQLYSAMAYLLIFIFLSWHWWRVQRISGLLFAEYVFTIALERFVMDFWRADTWPCVYAPVLTYYQVWALAIMCFGLWLRIYAQRRAAQGFGL